MREREYSLDNKFSQDSSFIDKFQRKIGAPFRGALVLLAVSAASCGGDDSRPEDSTRTPILEPTKVEKTITPITSPTEATLIVIASPTPEPTSEPTTDYVPPVVTPRPTLRPTPIPTPVMIRPTLEPTPVPAPKPTPIPTPTPEPIPTPIPTPTPTLTPLEVCNTGRFTNLVDGQTVSTRVDVKAQLAHDNNFSEGCLTDSAPNYVSVKAVVIDDWGRRWPWALYCGFVYPNIIQEEWQCFRNGVILSAYDHEGNDLELEIDGIVVDGVELNY